MTPAQVATLKQLEIRLDNPRGSYTWEDTILGTIELPQPVQVSQVRVTFSGRAKTKVWRSNGNGASSIYRGRAPLLQEEMLVKSHRDVDGSRIWSFAFRVPPTPEPSDIARVIACDSRYWDDFKISPRYRAGSLPPSFQHNYTGLVHRFESYVSYHITALVGGNSRGLIRAELPVRILPPKPAILHSPYLDRSFVRFQSLRLLPGNEDRDLTFKEKSRSIFKSSSLPTFWCDCQMEVPRNIIVGERIEVPIRLLPDLKKSTAPASSVVLKSFKIEINAETVVRAKSLLSEPSSESNVPVYYSLSKQGQDVCVFNKDSDHRAVLRTNAPPGLTPTFSTFNIDHKHSIKVKVVLGCAGEDFDRKVERPVQICTGVQREPTQESSSSKAALAETIANEPNGESSDQPGSSRAHQVDGMEDSEMGLPSYEEALSAPQVPESIMWRPAHTHHPSTESSAAASPSAAAASSSGGSAIL